MKAANIRSTRLGKSIIRQTPLILIYRFRLSPYIRTKATDMSLSISEKSIIIRFPDLWTTIWMLPILSQTQIWLVAESKHGKMLYWKRNVGWKV